MIFLVVMIGVDCNEAEMKSSMRVKIHTSSFRRLVILEICTGSDLRLKRRYSVKLYKENEYQVQICFCSLVCILNSYYEDNLSLIVAILWSTAVIIICCFWQSTKFI